MHLKTCKAVSRLLAVMLTAALLISPAMPALKAHSSPSQDQKPRKLQKTSASDAVALLAYLLDRYAENPANKTALDKSVARALSRIQDSRNVARRLVENFRRIPLADRQAVFGKYGDLRSQDNVPDSEIKVAFKRAIEGAPKARMIDKLPPPADPTPLPNPSRKHLKSEGRNEPQIGGAIKLRDRDRIDSAAFETKRNPGGWQVVATGFSGTSNTNLYQRGFELQYRGIYCQQETDSDRGSDSDEIYVVTTVFDPATGETTSMDHPRGRPPYYEDVDDGERRQGPIRTIWTGTPATLAMFVAVREQDEGDPRLFRDSLDSIVTAAYQGAEDVVIPLASLILLLVGGIVEIASQFLDAAFGPGDDTIEVEGVAITAEQLRAFSTRALTEERGRPSYHFYTIHTNRDLGARYFVMFGVQGSITPGEAPYARSAPIAFPDLVITRFVEAGRATSHGGDIYLPIKVDVKNSGTFAAGVFKVEIRIKDSGGREYAVPFTVPGSADTRFAASAGPLAPGATLTFDGLVKIPTSEAGTTVQLKAIADTCAEAGLPAQCRVPESNETNNVSPRITVILP